MTNFWNSGTGKQATGAAEDAFMKEFTIIPSNTIATAGVVKVDYVEKTFEDNVQKFYEVTYKIIDGEFKNREVTQKIKPFTGSPEQIDRNLNMFLLLLNLCHYIPAHDNPPSETELRALYGRTVSIKIREWHLPKRDGSGMMDGNFVAEIYAANSIPTATGEYEEIKPITKYPVESALNRNATSNALDNDIPF